jgi:hypothetical protein
MKEERKLGRNAALSTLGAVLLASLLVALGNYHGYQGPVALEMSRNAIVRQRAAEAAQTNKLSWAEQVNKARAIVQKPTKHMLAVQRWHKVEELVAKRQKAIAARLAHLDGALEGKKAAATTIMQGAGAHKPKGKAFRPVHLFGGRFAKQEARREHKRSASQELSHLSKLNDEIFGDAASAKPVWKVQTAAQELASFGKLNKEVVGSKKYARPLAADTAAKELAQDASINNRVFARTKMAAAFKGDSAAAELQHLKAVDDAVVPHEDMSSGYSAKGVMSPLQIKKAWARSHPALAAKGAKAARKAVRFEEKKV